MARMEEHPTVISHRRSAAAGKQTADLRGVRRLDGDTLKRMALEAGADDAGVVSLARSELDDQRDEILAHYPWTRSLIAFVYKMNREPVRSPARSAANLEFHHSGHHTNAVGHGITRALEEAGFRGVNPSMGFPMEMDRWPGKTWLISHKPVAQAAGLGVMGIHRNLIHPRFGNFILLGTVLTDAEVDGDVDGQAKPLDFSPCLECKLCVAACPVGAIAADGHFDFAACFTHNYREFMGGFSDWVDQLAESKDARDYRGRVTDSETASMWQSLSYGANYKAAYCMAVCPAGEDVIAPFLNDRKDFLNAVVKPLQAREEPLYVAPGSDAELYAGRRFPHKVRRSVSTGLRPDSIASFLSTLRHVFQRHASAGLDATYHFSFRGKEETTATVIIRDKTIQVDEGLRGRARCRVFADSETWVKLMRKERSLFRALITRKLRIKGSPLLLLRFQKCFPL